MTTLVCLHPAPHSGAFFNTIRPLLNQADEVLTPDYPGYGSAPPPPDLPDIGYYARTLLRQLDPNDETVLLGFHTGCLVAAEMTLQAPELGARLLLIDVPYYTGIERAEKYSESVKPGAEGIEHWAFHAAFTYPSDEKFAELSAPGLLVATDSAMLEPTRAVSEVARTLKFQERPDIKRRVFEESAELTAALINRYLITT